MRHRSSPLSRRSARPWPGACALAVLLLVGCKVAHHNQTSSGGPVPEVRVYGALHEIMHAGDRRPRVKLSAVAPGPHAYAIGALSELRGEVTVLDDEIWLAHARDGAAPPQCVRASDEEATLLVAVRVERWSERALAAPASAATLDEVLAQLAQQASWPADQVLPVLVEGELTELRYHVVNGEQAGASHEEHLRGAVRGERARAHGKLVGFFSRAHQGVFTHRGSHSHFHVVLDDGSATGHVDAVALPAGTVVRFPSR